MKRILIVLGVMLTSQAAHAEAIYRASINVGGRMFQDLFVINGMPEFPIDSATLTGSVTVPGNFTVPFVAEYERGNIWVANPVAKIALNIEAVERGKKFKVRYEFTTEDMIHIKGTGYLEDGSKLGDFEGVRIFNQ